MAKPINTGEDTISGINNNTNNPNSSFETSTTYDNTSASNIPRTSPLRQASGQLQPDIIRADRGATADLFSILRFLKDGKEKEETDTVEVHEILLV